MEVVQIPVRQQQVVQVAVEAVITEQLPAHLETLHLYLHLKEAMVEAALEPLIIVAVVGAVVQVQLAQMAHYLQAHPAVLLAMVVLALHLLSLVHR